MRRPTSCPTSSMPRLGEIEEAVEEFEARPIRYEADDLALAGLSSASTAPGGCASSGAMCERRMNRSRKWKMWARSHPTDAGRGYRRDRHVRP